MVEKLEDLLPTFSFSNCARCFTHVLNLIAKSLLKQFDVTKESQSDDELNEEEAELLNLAKDLETEELTTAQETDGDDGEIEDEDDFEGWVDEVAVLTPMDRDFLEDDIRPVKMMLVKVSRNRYSTHHLRLNPYSFGNWPIRLCIHLRFFYQPGRSVLKNWSCCQE